ncbi:thermonuclease family protein [Sphingobacterium sp. SGR-19]|uniref:thermonuclease family protein n=1 Tax=Sphingobacterium sp. SGR-19 TaxID=2710886 RepID=UPI0013ECC481|nr:thermonuclease family protein [Sphingobacterium sp. SGR-19]NGM64217.1 nuclease [Sphingobacterium sp. SGR-19]
MKNRYIFTVLSVLLCYISTACQSQSDYVYSVKGETEEVTSTPRENEPPRREKEKRWKEGYAYVTKVIDGDTFWVDNGKESFKVRFIGIDAPETRNSRWKQKGYFATESKEYVQSKTEHQWVRLEFDVQAMDRYKRRLAYIYLEDGTFLNASLVERGYAVVDTYPPNVKHVEQFIDLQKQARNAKQGLWGKVPK